MAGVITSSLVTQPLDEIAEPQTSVVEGPPNQFHGVKTENQEVPQYPRYNRMIHIYSFGQTE